MSRYTFPKTFVFQCFGVFPKKPAANCRIGQKERYDKTYRSFLWIYMPGQLLLHALDRHVDHSRKIGCAASTDYCKHNKHLISQFGGNSFPCCQYKRREEKMQGLFQAWRFLRKNLHKMQDFPAINANKSCKKSAVQECIRQTCILRRTGVQNAGNSAIFRKLP